MNIYFDTEFTGLKKNTTLVSIGAITEDGDTFYAEFTDYDKTYNDEWFKENVLDNLILLNPDHEHQKVADIQVTGTKDQIKMQLILWMLGLCADRTDELTLVSDVCHYDMVLFIDIFGGAFDLPQYVSPVCHDINSDIARYFNESEKAAFDRNREDILSNLHVEFPDGVKHNSLYDAKVIRAIYQTIQSNELNEEFHI